MLYFSKQFEGEFVAFHIFLYLLTGINWGIKVRPTSPYNKSLSNIIVKRGNGASFTEDSSLAEKDMYPSWLPSTNTLTSYFNERSFLRHEKSIGLLTNSQLCIDPLDRIVEKAWNMFTSKAYVHQYTRHGLTEQHFTDCFATLEGIIYDYRKL